MDSEESFQALSTKYRDVQLQGPLHFASGNFVGGSAQFFPGSEGGPRSAAASPKILSDSRLGEVFMRMGE